MLRWIALLTLCLSPYFAGASTQDHPVAGTYFLNGVMEMGARLIMKEDGTYDGYIEYGAATGYSEGTWEATEGDILLVSSIPRQEVDIYSEDYDPYEQEDDLGGIFDGLVLVKTPGCLRFKDDRLACFVKSN